MAHRRARGVEERLGRVLGEVDALPMTIITHRRGHTVNPHGGVGALTTIATHCEDAQSIRTGEAGCRCRTCLRTCLDTCV